MSVLAAARLSACHRSGHSASVVGDDVIFFGGSRGRKWATNVVVLDTDR